MGYLDGRKFAIEMGNVLRARLPGNRVHLARCFDRLRPILFLLENLQQELETLLFVECALQLGEQLFRPVQQPRLQIVLCKFVQRRHLLLGHQIRPLEQVFVHADGALHFAAAAEQAAECEVQFYSLRIDLYDLDKGLDSLVGLLVEEEIESLEIRQRQCAGFGYPLLDVDARSKPAEGEEQGKSQKPPEFKFHVSDRIPDQYKQ